MKVATSSQLVTFRGVQRLNILLTVETPAGSWKRSAQAPAWLPQKKSIPD
jgi:hypothetical protein